MGAREEPAGEHGARREGAGLARQIGEDALRHVLRERGIARHLAQRNSVNEPDVPPHQLAKGAFGAFFGVAAEQFGVIRHGCRL